MRNFTTEAKRIIERMNSGIEVNYKGADYLFYGMGLYAYRIDLEAAGCEFEYSINDAFAYIVPTVKNVAKFLKFISEV